MVDASTRRSMADRALRASPFQWAFRRQANDRLTVLAYHGIDDLSRFRQHLDYLTDRSHLMSLSDLLSAIEGGKRLPAGSVLLTFDDGERSVLEAAAPELRARSIPSVVFVVAGLLDTDQPFWWVEAAALAGRGTHLERYGRLTSDEVIRTMKRVPDGERIAMLEELRERAAGVRVQSPQLTRADLAGLDASGMAVANHSLTHPCLSRCTLDKVQQEISESTRTLLDILGHHPRAFAYPDGDCSDAVRSVVADEGYEAAFLFDHRLSLRTVPDSLRISRVRVNSTTTLDRFATIVSGLHPAIHHARGRG